MNRVAILRAAGHGRLLLPSNSVRQLQFGLWWNNDAGWFRRIRGQGVRQEKIYDHLSFEDRADIKRQYPFLYKFILRRMRDQARGRKYFPIFPDILFYLKERIDFSLLKNINPFSNERVLSHLSSFSCTQP